MKDFRLDVHLWGVNTDERATPELRFITLGQQVRLHRLFAQVLGRSPRPGEHQQAATVLLGRRVTTFRAIRHFEFRRLYDVLGTQLDEHPAAPYGEGDYR
ncbi:hypothetical protein DM785_02435 [Deinococcus actinosclerus]|nr:hypothetical protein DM785_02435 [Deinococcus actinosclerus]